jgi:lipopolysaccharide transport system ATP-binding protein
MKKDKVIELKNVAITYKRRKSFFRFEEYTALKNITFDVFKGETLGIVGRNGAGKSTLLRLLAGIIKPDEGSIKHHINNVSLMTLSSGFDGNLNGRENALMSGMLLGYSKKDMLSKLEGIKVFSELQDFFEKPVKYYSSGMKARLAFSTAISASPDILLIDEVLGVGDASFKNKAERVLEDKINSDTTVIIVSHSEKQVSRLADRAIWIDGGKVRKEGLPEEIFPEYNINVSFSTYNLRVDNYILDKDFFAQFEVRNFEDGILTFDCVIIDLQNRYIESVAVSSGSDYSSKMLGPTVTPGFSSRYPDFLNAKNSRYHGGKIKVGEKSHIVVTHSSTNTESVVLTVLLNFN